MPLAAFQPEISKHSNHDAGLLTSAEKEALLMQQLPHVDHIARRIHCRLPQHVEVCDLISAGVVGLLDAVQKYDPLRQVKFSSYAHFRIRGAILDSLRTLDWSPRHLRREARRIESLRAREAGRLGRNATDNELAGALGVTLRDFQKILGELRGLEVRSIENPDATGERYSFKSNFSYTEADCPFTHRLKSEMHEHLIEALSNLPDKERQVLALYYLKELTMKEVGTSLGVVESRISQIHTSAIIHLRSDLVRRDFNKKKASSR